MRRLTRFPTLFVVVVLTTGGCASGSGKAGDAATNKDLGDANDAVQASDLTAPGDRGGARDTAVDIPADAGFVPPANVTFPEPPEMSCAGSASDCEFPPSACAAPSCDGGNCPGLQWVVYYDAPSCVGGKCKYTNRYFECTSNTACSAGGCRFNGTALLWRSPAMDQLGVHGSCAPSGGDTTRPSPHISSDVFGPGKT